MLVEGATDLQTSPDLEKMMNPVLLDTYFKGHKVMHTLGSL